MGEACRNSSTKDMTLEVKQELLMNNGSGMTKKEFVTYIEVKIGDGGGPDKTALEKLQQGGWTQIQHFKSTGSVESTYSSEEGGSWALSRGGSMESLESLESVDSSQDQNGVRALGAITADEPTVVVAEAYQR